MLVLPAGSVISIGYETNQTDVEFDYAIPCDWEFPAGDSFINNLILPAIEEHMGQDIYTDDGDYRAWQWTAVFKQADGEWIDLINYKMETAQ